MFSEGVWRRGVFYLYSMSLCSHQLLITQINTESHSTTVSVCACQCVISQWRLIALNPTHLGTFHKFMQ